jgi:histo-blood group ABO system transferase
MSVALVTIATGEKYRNYAYELIATARHFWPRAHTIMFTDEPRHICGLDHVFKTEAKGYPNETLMRYHTMLSQEKFLADYDHIFYADADMRFVADVEDIPSPAYSLYATLHPGYVNKNVKGTPETNCKSRAFCDWNNVYVAGGFQGGQNNVYISAMHTMRERIQADLQDGITAVWHDESHWNRFIADHKYAVDIAYLTPSFCYPENYDGRWGWQPNEYKPVLVAVDKKGQRT